MMNRCERVCRYVIAGAVSAVMLLSTSSLANMTSLAETSNDVPSFDESTVIRKTKNKIKNVSTLDAMYTEEEFAANGSIFTSEHTLDQKVSVKYDTKSDYIKFTQLDGEIHNIIGYEDENMNFGVYYHVDGTVVGIVTVVS